MLFMLQQKKKYKQQQQPKPKQGCKRRGCNCLVSGSSTAAGMTAAMTGIRQGRPRMICSVLCQQAGNKYTFSMPRLQLLVALNMG
jgi:hypothetical protein